MGFFSQCERKHNYTYKVISAASIYMHHKVVTDQHIFPHALSKSCMNGVMVVCACMHIRRFVFL